MTKTLPALVRMATFRLALLHAGLSILFAVLVLGFIYSTTALDLERAANEALDDEFSALAAAYGEGAEARLNQAIIERGSTRGRFFYLMTGPDGDKIAGDFDALPALPPERGVGQIRFRYTAIDPEGQEVLRWAEGRLAMLPTGGAMLVASDSEERSHIVSRITNVVIAAGGIGLALSLVGGVLVARQAERRVQDLSATADAVMAGDLSQRARVGAGGDEFDRLSDRLNAMLDRIETLVSAQKNTGDAIAHDLRTPLTRMRNKLEAAAKAAEGDAQADVLIAAKEEAEGVLAAFNAILRLTRLRSGEPIQREPLDLSELSEELVELYEPAFEEKGVDLKFEADQALTVKGDRALLAQALSNLLDNALKYTPSGGGATVRVWRRPDDQTEMSVTDTGPGVPADQRERVTQRFVRLEKSRSTPGYGLGLSLVSAVAELHDGDFALQDGPAVSDAPGLRAVIRLPK